MNTDAQSVAAGRPLISVIIPTYRSWGTLEACLDCLERQSHPKGRTEIIIVNNSPGDPPPRSISRRDIILLNEERAGAYAARNRGLTRARGDIIAFTDADCLPRPEWLNVISNAFVDDPYLGRVGGKLEVFAAQGASRVAFLHDSLLDMRQELYVSHDQFAATGNMAARRDVFERVGLFDPRYLSSGDKEWGKRAEAEGIGIRYLADAVVRHPARPTVSAVATKVRRLTGGRVRTKLETRSLASMRLRYVLATPVSVLPVPSVLRKMRGLGVSTRTDRVRMFLLLNYLAAVAWIERGRLMLPGAEARRQ